MTAFAFPLTGLVSALAVLVLIWIGLSTAGARKKFEVPAPRMDGPDGFMRALRVEANSIEQAVTYFPMLWLFAMVAGDKYAAAVGVFWPIGRILYSRGYREAANKRSTGFLITFLSTTVMTLGSIGMIVWSLLG